MFVNQEDMRTYVTSNLMNKANTGDSNNSSVSKLPTACTAILNIYLYLIAVNRFSMYSQITRTVNYSHVHSLLMHLTVFLHSNIIACRLFTKIFSAHMVVVIKIELYIVTQEFLL